MKAIQINNCLLRDDRGCPYKYSSRRLAEIAAEMIVRKMWRQTYNIVEYGNNLFR